MYEKTFPSRIRATRVREREVTKRDNDMKEWTEMRMAKFGTMARTATAFG